MIKENLTFNDLPQVVAQLRDEVMGMKQMLGALQRVNEPRKQNTHRPMSVEEASEYLRIPINTLYMKLANGVIPATKPGKRYVLANGGCQCKAIQFLCSMDYKRSVLNYDKGKFDFQRPSAGCRPASG